MAPQHTWLCRQIAKRPQAYSLVPARCRQHLAIRTKRHPINRVFMAPSTRGSAERLLSDHRRTVLSATRCRQHLAIRTKRHPINRCLSWPRSTRGSADRLLSDHRRTVLSATRCGQHLAIRTKRHPINRVCHGPAAPWLGRQIAERPQAYGLVRCSLWPTSGHQD